MQSNDFSKIWNQIGMELFVPDLIWFGTTYVIEKRERTFEEERPKVEASISKINGL